MHARKIHFLFDRSFPRISFSSFGDQLIKTSTSSKPNDIYDRNSTRKLDTCVVDSLSLSFVSCILTKYSMIDDWRIFIRAGGVDGAIRFIDRWQRLV